MKQLLLQTLFLTTLFLAQTANGQLMATTKQLNSYLASLKAAADSILIVKSGCFGCEVKYSDTVKGVANGQSTYVLSQHHGRTKVAIFRGNNPKETVVLDTCSIFHFINQQKGVLKQKEPFYKKELDKLKKAQFFPPRPAHNAYEELTILLPKFTYNFQVVDKYFDYLGVSRANERWFTATQQILLRFFATVSIKAKT